MVDRLIKKQQTHTYITENCHDYQVTNYQLFLEESSTQSVTNVPDRDRLGPEIVLGISNANAHFFT